MSSLSKSVAEQFKEMDLDELVDSAFDDALMTSTRTELEMSRRLIVALAGSKRSADRSAAVLILLTLVLVADAIVRLFS